MTPVIPRACGAPALSAFGERRMTGPYRPHAYCEAERGKRIFWREQDANKHIAAMGDLSAKKRAYPCPFGGHWHVGARRSKHSRAALEARREDTP